MWKIIADSGSNIVTLGQEVAYERVPLTIQIGPTSFVDDAALDCAHMMETMYASDLAATTSCPSPDAYVKAFDQADKIIVITITGTLSGSNNSARLAKEAYLEDHPQAQIHIIDSLSAGGEMDLLIVKAQELIAAGQSFEAVVAELEAYQTKTSLLFVLSKVDNLVKNGRLSKLVGKVVGLLNIRMVGRADHEGRLELLHKARGQKKAVAAVIEEMQKAGYQGGKVMLAHLDNPKLYQSITEAIHQQYPQAEVKNLTASGLCQFYVEKEGLIMGYEIA